MEYWKRDDLPHLREVEKAVATGMRLCSEELKLKLKNVIDDFQSLKK